MDRIKVVLHVNDDTQVLYDNGSAAPVPEGVASGPVMEQPRVGYAFGAGKTSLPMPVQAGQVYTIEGIPNGRDGYPVGTVTVTRGDGGVVSGQFTGGFCPAFPVQATATESLTVLVDTNTPGLLRYVV